MQRGNMSREVFEQVLELIIGSASAEDLDRIAAEARRQAHAKMLLERCKLYGKYRARWYAELRDRPAAAAIEKDVNRAASQGFLHRASPPIKDPKKADAFELLRAGPRIGADRIRKLFPLGQYAALNNPKNW